MENEKLKMENFVIVNETERPCAHLIAELLPSGRVRYVNKILRKRYKNLRLSTTGANLKDFGFVFENDKFVKRYASNLKYTNGHTRRWQGKESFSYSEIENATVKEWD